MLFTEISMSIGRLGISSQWNQERDARNDSNQLLIYLLKLAAIAEAFRPFEFGFTRKLISFPLTLKPMNDTVRRDSTTKTLYEQSDRKYGCLKLRSHRTNRENLKYTTAYMIFTNCSCYITLLVVNLAQETSVRYVATLHQLKHNSS